MYNTWNGQAPKGVLISGKNSSPHHKLAKLCHSATLRWSWDYHIWSKSLNNGLWVRHWDYGNVETPSKPQKCTMNYTGHTIDQMLDKFLQAIICCI